MRRALTVAAWCVAACAPGIGLAHGALATDTSSPWTLAALAGLLICLLLSVAAHKPSPTVVLTLLATVAPLVWSFVAGRQGQSTSSVEFFVLLSQLSLAAGLAVFVRRRLGPRATAVLADGVIVGMGTWVVTWVVLVRPLIDADDGSGLTTVLRGSVLGAAMVVLFLLATLLFSDTSPSPSVGLFGVAIGLGLVGIVLRALSFRADIGIEQGTYEAPFLMAAVLAGAALAHPTVREVHLPGVVRMSPPLMTRLVTTTVSLIAPIIVLALTDASNTQDRVVRTISVSVLAIAAMARIIQSVRANATTQERLVRNALTDSLTGLPNRVLMLEHIQNSVQQSWRTRKQPTVLFIDVDRFKTINDSLGHSIGDDVLMHVASRLLTSVNAESTVARISGDEFVVLDPTTESPTQSVVLAERILDAFREPVSTPQGDMFVTASIGVAYAPRGMDLGADEILRHADTAMYRAKAAGRNCIALFDDSMLHTVSRRLDVETALYRALERGELRLVHQPIVDIDLGVVVGFEALMRWQRSDGAHVSPADFIPIAEETGTIVPLGSWAINDALTQLRQWIETGVVPASTTMSVNVSPRQLNDPQFVTTVSNALESTGVAADQLWLEVTESVMITEPAQALSALRRLNALGVRIAIDDFGTGYSSLSLLQQFPIQCIKIDKAFVQDMTADAGTQNLVRTIIAMAETMGADVVAEGIETAEQLAALRSLDCHRAQGYLISTPVSPSDVPSVVRALHDSESWRRGGSPA